jgi:hypothetical protein
VDTPNFHASVTRLAEKDPLYWLDSLELSYSPLVFALALNTQWFQGSRPEREAAGVF